MGNDRNCPNILEQGVSPIAVATIRSAIGGGLLLAITIIMKKINF